MLFYEQVVVSVPTRNKGSRTDEMNRFVFMDFEFECLKKQRQPFGWRCLKKTHFCFFGGSITTPLIRRMVFGEAESFDFTTMTLVKCPVLLVLYFTLMSLSPFGGMGSFGHSGTTQPHDEKAELMTSGAGP